MKEIFSGCIYIADTDKVIDELTEMKGSAAKIIDTPVIRYTISYPLTTEVEIHEVSDSGFSIGGIIVSISEQYQRIYEEEEESTRIAVLPVEERGNVINRNETNGKYGIWGHDITDLCIEKIDIEKVEETTTYLKLYIGS